MKGATVVLCMRREGLAELKQYIDQFWDDRLMRLKEAAEAEERKL